MKIIFNITFILTLSFLALSVVFIKHQNRIMQIQLEDVEKQLSLHLSEHMNILNTLTKIENKIYKKGFEESIGMKIPTSKNTIYLNLLK